MESPVLKTKSSNRIKVPVFNVKNDEKVHESQNETVPRHTGILENPKSMNSKTQAVFQLRTLPLAWVIIFFSSESQGKRSGLKTARAKNEQR